MMKFAPFIYDVAVDLDLDQICENVLFDSDSVESYFGFVPPFRKEEFEIDNFEFYDKLREFISNWEEETGFKVVDVNTTYFDLEKAYETRKVVFRYKDKYYLFEYEEGIYRDPFEDGYPNVREVHPYKKTITSYE